MDEGVLKERAYEELLGLVAREAAVLEVGDLLGGDRTDGGTMVAGHVVLVAEDDGHGLVDHVVTDHEHALGLAALGAAPTVHEVDRGAQALPGGAVEHAGLGPAHGCRPRCTTWLMSSTSLPLAKYLG